MLTFVTYPLYNPLVTRKLQQIQYMYMNCISISIPLIDQFLSAVDRKAPA